MSISIDAGKKNELVIKGELTIHAMRKAHSDLLDLILEKKNLSIDLSGVDKIDSAGYQLLQYASLEVEKRGGRISFISPSLPVNELFNLYGTPIQEKTHG